MLSGLLSILHNVCFFSGVSVTLNPHLCQGQKEQLLLDSIQFSWKQSSGGVPFSGIRFIKWFNIVVLHFIKPVKLLIRIENESEEQQFEYENGQR